jgi:hypothetical protein
MRIYNLLRLIAYLEDLYENCEDNDLWIDGGLSINTIYQKSLVHSPKLHDYLRYKYRLQEKHYKTRVAQKASLAIKKKYLNMSKSQKQLNWFDRLPSLIKHQVFLLLNHQDLVNFSNSYPKYLPSIARPEYWKNLNVNLNEAYFSYDDLLLIFKYLGNNLHKISIEMAVDSIEMNTLLSYTCNLTHLSVKYVDDMNNFVDFLVNNLVNLEFLNIQHFDMYDTHLTKLSKLPKLKSMPLQGALLTTDGIQDFIKRLDSLKSFSIKCNKRIEEE